MSEQRGSHCAIYFDVINKFKQSFGTEFDKLPFQTSSGQSIVGADFNGAISGCEILDRQGLGWMCQCRLFDEKIRLTSEGKMLPAGSKYIITLADGRIVSGCTDDAGCTERIKSSEPIGFERIEIFVDDLSPCCGDGHIEEVLLSVDLNGVHTSKEGFGQSEKHVTVEKGYRPLIEGEIGLARLLFKDSINYGSIRVYNKKYFAFHPKEMAIAPNGHPADFKEDFSIERTRLKRWFIHEMTHVWQHQLGYPVLWRVLIRFGLPYRHELAEGRRLSDYNMEAQGDVLADYLC
ncbi:hypothetical protein ACIPZC_22285 [Pseudomonas sp. NPDC089743]|uniref:hypothetical protein n=1 Tax=Pseudomonas sp. NPDC089743 TaxID=3364471 RepID=UPI00382DB2A3